MHLTSMLPGLPSFALYQEGSLPSLFYDKDSMTSRGFVPNFDFVRSIGALSNSGLHEY